MNRSNLAAIALLAVVGFSPSAEGHSASQDQSASTQDSSFADLRQRAEVGDTQAQYLLFLRYKERESTLAERTEAISWLRKAAEAGHAMAQVTLGLLYKGGKRGVVQNSEEAVKWFRKSAEQCNAYGQSELGLMYETGDGVAKDEAEAVRWYTRAADQGLAVSKFDLAFMYENGHGVAADIPKAIALYEEAALSIPTARHNLAVLYYDGKLVGKDSIAAYKWAVLSISAEFMRIIGEAMGKEQDSHHEPRLGHAVLLLEDIAKGMKKKDKQVAIHMAQEWINANSARLGEEPQHFPNTLATIKK